MKKSVYSLVLSDDLVRAVDQLAYSKRTSRSNLINQILAEHLSLITPEARMRAILSHMEELMGADHGFQLSAPSSSQLSLRSFLSYKYNPTVQYSVLLYPNPTDAIGELRVLFRTQNQALIEMLTDFFRLWAQIEAALVPDSRIHYRIENGKFTRTLSPMCADSACTETDLAQAATAYLRLFDGALKTYFAHPPSAPQQITRAYRAYLQRNRLIL